MFDNEYLQHIWQALFINNFNNPIIKYSAEYSDYSKKNFLLKINMPTIPNIRLQTEYF